LIAIYCIRNLPVKITRPWSLASHCFSHRWLMVENWLRHYVNMAVRVTLCSFRCRASQKLATFLGAFHRCLLLKAKGTRLCLTCCNTGKFTVSFRVIGPNILSSEKVDFTVPGSEKVSVESEWRLIDYHPLFEALDIMTAGGWGCYRIRGTERHSVGFGLPTAAIQLYCMS